MKAAEILRKLADLVDTIERGDTEPESDNTGVMVPPLQQKIEIMKKSQGLDNIYDQDEDEPFEG